ncbi:MAG: hypothetical protein JXD18_09965 [Anaerolineae bacterium]|nr:hypothetical protein [Anaerolineae bacterium]
MNAIRRVLGLLVMLAGVLGLLLSLAGLVLVWVQKPAVTTYANTTIDTLDQSVTTSQHVMQVTEQALGATTDSLDALAAMLETTATTVEETQPVLDEVNTIMAVTLPSTLEATTASLYTAQEAARVLESTIQSLDAFRFLLSATPLIGGLVEQPGEPYSPDQPLADSLGELAANIEGLPETFTGMSADLSTTDDNLAAIQDNLLTMSHSVELIASSLDEYERMVGQSRSSMDDLTSILATTRSNLTAILNGAAIVLTLFFVWLLAAQVVILSQGWELYQGTANRMGRETTPQ